MLIDHLVYGVPDLRAGVDDLEQRLGVRARDGGQHVGIGTHNALLGFGSRTYLEIIAPDPDQPAPSTRRPFGLDELTEPKLVAWAIACDDIDAAITKWRGLGVDPGEVSAMHRRTAEGAVLGWRMTLNAFDGGSVPFLIAWGDTPQPAQSAPTGLTLDDFQIECPDPAALTPLLAAVGVDVVVRAASRTELVAHISGPNGRQELLSSASDGT